MRSVRTCSAVLAFTLILPVFAEEPPPESKLPRNIARFPQLTEDADRQRDLPPPELIPARTTIVEIEPNDDEGDATPIGLVDETTVTIEGTLGNGPDPDYDRDYFSFSISNTSMVTLDVSLAEEGVSFGLGITCHPDPWGVVPDPRCADANPNWPLQGSVILFGPGPYYFFLGSGDLSDYTVTLTTTTSFTPPSSLGEPNDTITQATPTGIVGGGTFVGSGYGIDLSANTLTDVDLFEFELTEPAAVRVFVTPVSDTLDPLTYLFDANGQWLAASGDADVDSYDIVLQALVEESGLHYVGVSGCGNTYYDPTTGQYASPGCIGDYDITVEVQPLADGGPDEPNDSLPTATPIVLSRSGSFATSAAIGSYGSFSTDYDIYRFDATAGETMDIDIAVPPGSDLAPVMVLYDLAQTRLATGTTHISLMAAATQTHYLLVTGQGTTLPFDIVDRSYSKGVGSTGEYELNITVAPAGATNEPNGTTDLAIDTGLNQVPGTLTIQAAIGDNPALDTPSDVDIYKLNAALDPEAWIVVKVEYMDSPTGSAPGLSLFHETFSEFRRGKSAFPLRETYIVHNTGSAGIHYIAVWGDETVVRKWPEPEEGSVLCRTGTSGAYELTISVYNTFPPPVGPHEPNDLIGDATTVGLSGPGTTRLAATIGDGSFADAFGDADLYAITLGNDERLEVCVSGTGLTPLSAPAIGVSTTDGDSLKPLITYDADGVSASIAPGCETSLGDLIVAVGGANARLPADYGAAYIGGDSEGDYEIEFTIISDPTTSAEPDDTLATATDTGLSGSSGTFAVRAFIDSCDGFDSDVDLYRFDADADTRIVVIADASRFESSLNSALSLFDDLGNLLEQVAGTYAQDSFLAYSVSTTGTYYVGVSGVDNIDYDPNVADSGEDDTGGVYQLTISLGSTEGRVPRQPGFMRLFAARRDALGRAIDRLDPQDGQLLNTFDAPVDLIGGPEGLAFDGESLYFLANAYDHQLFVLDPDTGSVLDSTYLTLGTGRFDGLAFLADKLYVLDAGEGRILEIDPDSLHVTNSLDVGGLNGLRLTGGLGALAGPNRLLAGHSRSNREIYEIDPVTGLVTSEFVGPASLGTGLAGGDADTIYLGDWHDLSVQVLDRDGGLQGFIPLADPISALAAPAFIPGDSNFDGDVDMSDFIAFNICFGGPDTPIAPECEIFDSDGDGDVDLRDFLDFQTNFTGPK